MKSHLLLFGLTSALATGFVSCVDNDYDLSDIDTTTRLTVNDLVVPVNIDEVELGDIITFDDDSRIKVVEIGGKTFYALTETGTFSSDPIHIKNVTAHAPGLDPTTRTLRQVVDENRMRGRAASVSGNVATYEIEHMGNDFTYSAFEVDEAIVDLDAAKTETMHFRIHLDCLNLDENVKSINFTDLTIQLPKGLTASTNDGSYNPRTGLWIIPTFHVNGKSAEAILTSTAIDFKANDTEINSQRDFIFHSEFKVLSGLLTVTTAEGHTLPPTLEFRASYALDDIKVKSFSGTLNYNINGMSIDPVDLSDLPEFLSGEGTSILLANPQLYIGLNNPVAGERLNYRAGISITAKRDNYRDLVFPMDNGTFAVGYNHGITGPYNFVLAPSDKDLNTPAKYAANLSFQRYTALSDMLAIPEADASQTLPKQLVVSVVEPGIPTQDVEDFDLGVDLPGVDGSYEFVAPLNLEPGSQITYSERRDGWNDEDLDAVVISRLSLTATAVNNTPLTATLVAYPIDVNGNVINDVEIKSNILGADSSTDVVIEMTGEVRHLDGVIFKATVHPGDDNRVLEPSQTIKLSNIRARVTGYYEKEL